MASLKQERNILSTTSENSICKHSSGIQDNQPFSSSDNFFTCVSLETSPRPPASAPDATRDIVKPHLLNANLGMATYLAGQVSLIHDQLVNTGLSGYWTSWSALGCQRWRQGRGNIDNSWGTESVKSETAIESAHRRQLAYT